MGFSGLRRALIGEPFPSSFEMHERLDKVRGLAIFASDPISSNAYATEAIMSVLILLGSGALHLTMPIGIAVASLVLIVVFSYVQTILHYPGGGGAYIVAKDNLGRTASLLAAAALLIDYVLTVSVSVSAGVRAITSAFPEAFPLRVIIALAAILLITWINLRGIRESGTIFAIPTYAFIAGVLLVIVIGIARFIGFPGTIPMEPAHHVVAPAANLTGFALTWLLLRAFAGGCTALTGIEAISDGVKAFKPPEPINAAKTMVAMGVIAMTLFLGITFLATHLQLVPEETESILSQLTRKAAGTGFLYYWVQIFTAAILFMAANTGYQDFPRLSFFLSHDNYLPRWLKQRGDRLVFSAGITVLALLASLLVIVFQADEIAMLPLYALGVMLGFSLSQMGMFHLMGQVLRLKPGETAETSITQIHYEKNAKWKRLTSLTGAIITSVVFLILLATKFLEGAWLVALMIPILVIMFYSIHRHYEGVATALSTQELDPESFSGVANVVIIPIADVHRGSLLALQYARRLSSDVRAISVVTSPEIKERLEERWARFPQITDGVKLMVINYDYRDILTPIVEYIEQVNNVEFPNQLTTVVIPEFVPDRLIARVMHNQTAARLRWLLRSYKDIVIIEVPFQINSAM